MDYGFGDQASCLEALNASGAPFEYRDLMIPPNSRLIVVGTYVIDVTLAQAWYYTPTTEGKSTDRWSRYNS